MQCLRSRWQSQLAKFKQSLRDVQPEIKLRNKRSPRKKWIHMETRRAAFDTWPNSGKLWCTTYCSQRPVCTCRDLGYSGADSWSRTGCVCSLHQHDRTRLPRNLKYHTVFYIIITSYKYFIHTVPRRWHSWLKRSPRKRNVGCSNPSRDRHKSLKQVVTAPPLNTRH